MKGTSSDPSFETDETWVDLPPLLKVSPGAAFELVDAMHKAGIPLRSPGAKSAGLFSGGKVNVTISVPESFQEEALSLFRQHFGDQ
jgi:hypothetical protein